MRTSNRSNRPSCIELAVQPVTQAVDQGAKTEDGGAQQADDGEQQRSHRPVDGQKYIGSTPTWRQSALGPSAAKPPGEAVTNPPVGEAVDSAHGVGDFDVDGESRCVVIVGERQ